jgi:simple sugar transport system permease protein
MNNTTFPIPLLHSTIRIMAPFLLAATGGLFTELAGMLNIALEGLMLIGAFFSVVFAAATGSLFLGIVLGIGASILAAYIFGFISLNLRANIFITGLATNLFAEGITVVLAFQIFGNKGVIRFENLAKLPVLRIPWLQRIPVLGDILVGHNVLVYVSWIMAVLAAIVIYKTPFGLRVRGTGSNPGAVEAMGLSPKRYRMYAILASGFTCGLAGAILSLQMGAYVPGVTAGRGWIALVAIYLGNKTPLGVVIACLVFGFADSLSNYAQGAIDMPADFVRAFPYIITVIAMIMYSIVRHYRLKGSER